MSLRNDDFTQPQKAAAPADTMPPVSGYEGVKNSGRRKLTGLGVGVPVILTLASRSVLAGQCLSNMLSGNLSDPNRDSNCSKGWSPGQWGTAGGKLGSNTTEQAWSLIGFTFGTFKTQAEDSSCYKHGYPKLNVTACYKDGSPVEALPGVLIKEVVLSGTPIRDILQQNSAYPLTRHLVCAYFNALYSGVDPNFNYILTVQQVLDLAGGAPVPPIYSGLQDFLDSTWG